MARSAALPLGLRVPSLGSNYPQTRPDAESLALWETAAYYFIGSALGWPASGLAVLSGDGRVWILPSSTLHRDGDGGKSKEEYVKKAAQFGTWTKHAHLVIDRARVTSVRRLGDL